MPRRRISCRWSNRTEDRPPWRARDSDPTGLHRVLDEPAVLPQAAAAARHPPRAVARRGPDPRREAQPRRRVVPPARAQARRRRRRGRAPRCSRSSPPAARCRTPRPAPAACSSAPSRRWGSGPRSGSRSGTGSPPWSPSRLTPLVIEDGLARWDGRSEQVPCDGYAVLFGRSIAAVIPDDLAPELSLSVMDVCGAPALTARVVGGVRRTDRRRDRWGRQVRLAEPGRRPGRRRRPHGRRRAAPGRGRPAHRRRHRRRRVDRRRPRPDRAARRGRPRPAGPPTSRSSASTSPAARAARSCPPPRAAPSSSSPWPPPSPRPRSAPRGWPPT